MTMVQLMVRGSDLPPLAWQKSDPFDVGRWNPISNRLGWGVKPFGGLWTAPLRDKGTAWTEWCEMEDWGHPEAPLTPITPDPDAAVFLIDDLAALLIFERRFTTGVQSEFRVFPNLDWEKAAAEVDAVWLTAAGEHRTRFTSPGLYGWDCETVLWLQPRFTTIDAEGADSAAYGARQSFAAMARCSSVISSSSGSSHGQPDSCR